MSKFNQLAAKLAQEPGVTNPRGLAYAIGARKFGAAKMHQAAAKGVPASSLAKKHVRS